MTLTGVTLQPRLGFLLAPPGTEHPFPSVPCLPPRWTQAPGQQGFVHFLTAAAPVPRTGPPCGQHTISTDGTNDIN